MSLRLQQRVKHKAYIPTASMADIAFLLIIFFMVTVTFEVDKTQVTLPQTVIRSEIPKKAAYISITENGVIRVSSGEEISVQVPGPDDVLAFAASVVARTPDKPFVLKADGTVEYRLVDQVIDALKQSEARLIYLLSDAERVETPSEPATGAGG